MLAALSAAAFSPAFGQAAAAANGYTSFRVGERLSYNVSFESFKDVVYLETYVVSRGKLSGRDVVELRSRVKTGGLVSAAFSLIDEERTVFADPASGQPLFVRREMNGGVLPKVVETNLMETGPNPYDLLTAIFKARETGGNGSFQIAENGESSTLTFTSAGSERVKTEAGDFDTTISTVQSSFFESRGIKGLRVWFSTDEARRPIAFSFRTAKGVFQGKISGISQDTPVLVPVEPRPTPTPTPVVKPTPRPTPSQELYQENTRLLPELIFQLGESLEYVVTRGGKPSGRVTIEAKERKLLDGLDTLVLRARVTGTEPGEANLKLGDSIVAKVNPETLAPRAFESKLGGGLAALTQNVMFDQRIGAIQIGSQRLDAPIGVHTLLSLIYSMRSFNLKPSKDLSNPVNDTRVAVFWVDRVYIFTLRPADADLITIGGERVAAQMVTINTGNAQLDALGLKVWLSVDGSRTPLRFTVGAYQADLVRTPTNRLIP